MKNSVVTVAILFNLTINACQPRQEATVPKVADTPAGLLINLTSDATVDPHSSLMGLHLGQNVLKNDLPVTIFLNVHGVKLMASEADTISFRDENLHTVLQSIMADGGQVIACPHCMEAHAIQEGYLLKGVTIARDTSMMTQIKRNPTVFTY